MGLSVGYSPHGWSDEDLAAYAASVDPLTPIDRGVVRAVRVLRDAGFATIESCEGGEGHSYPEPTIKFQGTRAGGWHALGTLMDFGFPIHRIGQVWTMTEGMPTGPDWLVTFWKRLD